jgi:hypothetical protein
MTEAFDKFQSWKTADTLLKLLISEKGNQPEVFLVNVASIDEASRIVNFADGQTGSLTQVNFTDAVFVIGKSGLEAVSR